MSLAQSAGALRIEVDSFQTCQVLHYNFWWVSWFIIFPYWQYDLDPQPYGWNYNHLPSSYIKVICHGFYWKTDEQTVLWSTSNLHIEEQTPKQWITSEIWCFLRKGKMKYYIKCQNWSTSLFSQYYILLMALLKCLPYTLFLFMLLSYYFGRWAGAIFVFLFSPHFQKTFMLIWFLSSTTMILAFILIL